MDKFQDHKNTSPLCSCEIYVLILNAYVSLQSSDSRENKEELRNKVMANKKQAGWERNLKLDNLILAGNPDQDHSSLISHKVEFKMIGHKNSEMILCRLSGEAR